MLALAIGKRSCAWVTGWEHDSTAFMKKFYDIPMTARSAASGVQLSATGLQVLMIRLSNWAAKTTVSPVFSLSDMPGLHQLEPRFYHWACRWCPGW